MNSSKNSANGIRQARLAQNLSQSELAAKIGCTQGAISRLEAGDFRAASADTLRQLFAVLGIEWPTEPEEVAGMLVCPTAGCPQNIPYLLNGRISFRPVPVMLGITTTRYCPACGTGLINQCPHCQTPLTSGATFCPDCGKPIIETSAHILNHSDPHAYLAAFERQRSLLRQESPFNLPAADQTDS